MLNSLVLVGAAVMFIGLTFYPFQYDFLESSVLVGVFLLLAIYELLEHSQFQTPRVPETVRLMVILRNLSRLIL